MSVGSNTAYSFASALANVNVDGFSTSNPGALNALVTLPNVIPRESRSSGPPRASDQVRVETSTLPWGQREVSVRFEDQKHSIAIDPRITAGLTDEDVQARLQVASEALSRRVLAQMQERIQNQIMSAILSSSSESSSRTSLSSGDEYLHSQFLGISSVSTTRSENEWANLVRRRIEEAQAAAQQRTATTSAVNLEELRQQLREYEQRRLGQSTIPIPAAKAKPAAPAKPTAPRRSVGRGRMPVLIEDGECEERP